jgi:radical SAM superfamily enzyme YgiQ (UPF0313 family)
MEPLGLIALKVYLDEFFDGTVQTTIFDFSDCVVDSYTLLEENDIGAYDLVGLCAYSTNFPIVLDWGRSIKKTRSSCPIVVGGPHTTSLSEHLVIAHGDVFDYAVRGEGELVLAALVQSLMQKNRNPLLAGLTYRTKLGCATTAYMDLPADLNLLPPPFAPVVAPKSKSMKYYDKKEKRLRNAIALTSSRGCPFRCSFCSISSTEAKWRAASAETIATWLRYAFAHSQEKLEHVYFMDADFMIRRERVVAIGAMFAQEFPGITWSFSGRVDDIKRIGEPALRLLASQGLRFIESGLESGSQAALDRMNKHVTVQDNLDALEILRHAGLQITVDFILFLPDSTLEHLRQTLEFLIKAGLTEHLPNDHFYSYLLLYPATPLRKYYEECFGIVLDLDVLPKPDELFIHESTKCVFKFFIRDFHEFRSRITALLSTIEVALNDPTAGIGYETRQKLRIESISLRHIPFFVLDQLLVSWEEPTLLDAVPWLRGFDDYATELEKICTITHLAA